MEDIKDQAEAQEKTGEGVPGFQYNYEIPYYYPHGDAGEGLPYKPLAKSAEHIVMAANVARSHISMAGCGPNDYLNALLELHRRVEGTIRLIAESYGVQDRVDRYAEKIRSRESDSAESCEGFDPHLEERLRKRHDAADGLMLGVLAEIFGDKS